jgi:hypothetical protein
MPEEGVAVHQDVAAVIGDIHGRGVMVITGR